jgi:hypothetical protein
MSKKSKSQSAVDKPLRDPDHISKRGVFYWFSPEWTRGTDGSNISFGKIKAIKEKICVSHGRPGGAMNHNSKTCSCPHTVNLYMVSKSGNTTYIQGSIQQEFKEWHEDRQIDYILLGETPESASDLIISETEETEYV